MNLYKISKDLAVLHQEIADAEGELSPDLEARLNALQGSVQQKVERIAYWYQNLKAEEQAFAAESDRLKRKRDARRKAMEWIKQYVKTCLEMDGLARIQTPIGTVRICQNSQAKLDHALPLQTQDHSAVNPRCYDLIPQHWELNEQRLREALERGEFIQGATLVRGTHVRIG